MSLIAITLNLVLAGLLVAALMMGARLNKRLKTLRDSHEGFTKAVADLDAAAMRAEQGLADLRAATDEAAETLGERMERARALISKLDERLARPVPTELDARRAALEARINSPVERTAAIARLAPVETTRSRASVDDDLFEGVTLKALAGGRR
ncbi:MAG: flagellar positioning protein PflI [Caulobacterales bacterium]|nr:flagellar positioning protein PflI [Caulobacterales bacterium]